MTRLDKIFSIIAFGLLTIITLLIIGGDRTVPRVAQFSHEGKIISAKTSQFSFTFNREMDKRSVEEGFVSEPPLDGTFSWSGKKAAFTLALPLDPSTTYTLRLSNARDARGVPLAEYVTHLQTRNPLLTYIGTESNELRKILLYDPLTKEKRILPTENLTILSIYPHPSGRYILFFALDKNTPKSASLEEYQELYSISIENNSITKLADNKGFRNSALSISPDGSFMMMRRQEVDAKRLISSSDHLYGSPFVHPSWQKFWYEEGNPPAHFTPNGRSVLVWNIREGFVLVPTSPMEQIPENIGNFQQSFGFSSDGSKALFTEFEAEGTTRNFNNIMVFYNKGEKQPLLKNTGSIAKLTFTPDGRFFYYLMMKKEDNTLGAPLFHLYAYDFDKGRVQPITTDPLYSEEQFAISPDGSQVVFERYPYLSPENKGIDQRPILEAAEKSFAGAELWSYKMNTMGEVTNLGIKGRSPKWVE